MIDMAEETPLSAEDHISQVPALQLLGNLGWKYLTPAEALEMRGGRTGGVILDAVLERQLRKLNAIRHRGHERVSWSTGTHPAGSPISTACGTHSSPTWPAARCIRKTPKPSHGTARST